MITSCTLSEGQSPQIQQKSRRLRVLIVCHAYVTGVNQGKLDAIASIDNVEVALLVPKRWNAMGWGRTINLETPYSRIKTYPSNILFSGRVGAYFYYPWRVFQVIQDFQPDVIHVEQEVFSVSALELSFFARLFRTPLTVFGWENMERQLSNFRCWIRKYVFDTANFIFSGNSDGEKLMRKWGYQGGLEIMPQIGVDTKLFPHQIRSRNSNDALVIGFMGRLVYQKGVDVLFKAAKSLKDKGLLIQVVICGSGPEEAALRKLASELQLEDIVRWESGVPHVDVPIKMKDFDVLVLPSRSINTWKEQFGHVLIEAMSMGIPVVGASSGEIPNVIGKSDLVFPENDSQGLSKILEKIQSDIEWYQQNSEYCVHRVKSLYSHEKIAIRLVNNWRKQQHL